MRSESIDDGLWIIDYGSSIIGQKGGGREEEGSWVATPSRLPQAICPSIVWTRAHGKVEVEEGSS